MYSWHCPIRTRQHLFLQSLRVVSGCSDKDAGFHCKSVCKTAMSDNQSMDAPVHLPLHGPAYHPWRRAEPMQADLQSMLPAVCVERCYSISGLIKITCTYLWVHIFGDLSLDTYHWVHILGAYIKSVSGSGGLFCDGLPWYLFQPECGPKNLTLKIYPSIFSMVFYDGLIKKPPLHFILINMQRQSELIIGQVIPA